MMKFKSKDILNCVDEMDESPFTLIEEGAWVDEGKYSYKTDVIQHNETGKFYEINQSRSGSYYTDYYYESEDWPEEIDLMEVEKVEIKTYVWKAVKCSG